MENIILPEVAGFLSDFIKFFFSFLPFRILGRCSTFTSCEGTPHKWYFLNEPFSSNYIPIDEGEFVFVRNLNFLVSHIHFYFTFIMYNSQCDDFVKQFLLTFNFFDDRFQILKGDSCYSKASSSALFNLLS